MRSFSGRKGLDSLLRESDVIIIALPLTRSTYELIGGEELSRTKEKAIFVNVARGCLIDQRALYFHLRSHPSFRYATDVWWYKDGYDTLKTDYPFAGLSNFLGAPHISGPTGMASGAPARLAIDNVLRYIRGKAPEHVVDKSEYVGMG